MALIRRRSQPGGGGFMTRTCNNLIYKNFTYGFSLTFPESWGKYCYVNHGTTIPRAKSTIHFNCNYQGKPVNIFSIFVFNMTKTEWMTTGFHESPLQYIASSKGKIFAYTTPEELPDQFLNPDKSDYNYKKYGKEIYLLKKMVNEDVPKIIQTIRKIKK
jgi:hypothetical protein